MFETMLYHQMLWYIIFLLIFL